MGKSIWTFLKFIGKLILLVLWGCCRLAELILQQVNVFLQSFINKH